MGVHCTCLLFHLKENTFPFLPKYSELFLLIIRDHSSPFLTPVTVVGKKVIPQWELALWFPLNQRKFISSCGPFRIRKNVCEEGKEQFYFTALFIHSLTHTHL